MDGVTVPHRFSLIVFQPSSYFHGRDPDNTNLFIDLWFIVIAGPQRARSLSESLISAIGKVLARHLIVVVDSPLQRNQRCWLIAGRELEHS
jgi:hypothetical protein